MLYSRVTSEFLSEAVVPQAVPLTLKLMVLLGYSWQNIWKEIWNLVISKWKKRKICSILGRNSNISMSLKTLYPALSFLQGLLWPLSLWHITFGNPGVPEYADKIGWVWTILEWLVAGTPLVCWHMHWPFWTHVNSLHLEGIISS